VPPRDRLLRSVVEVGGPVGAGVLIIVIVFLPLLTLQGLEGKLFGPVAITIVFALAASLLVAFTAIPVLSSLLLRAGAHGEPWLMRRLHAGYGPLLAASLARPWIPVTATALLLAGAVPAYLSLGKSFMPTLDEGDLLMQLEKLPSISLPESVDMDLRIQRALRERVPEVRHVIARTGADEIGLDPMGLNETDTFLVLAPPQAWRKPDKAAIGDAMRAVMQDFPGIAYSFTQPIEMRVSEMITGVRGDLAVKIFGPDLDTLNGLAQRTVRLLEGIAGAEDVLTVKNEGVQYYAVEIDRLRAGRLGLNVEDIQDLLRAQVEGTRVGIAIEPGRRTPVMMRGAQALRASPDAFARLIVDLPDGRSVPLSEVATLSRKGGPVKIDHENASRMVVVRANVRDRDLVGFVDDARAAFARDIALPPGYRAAWGGQFENQQRAAQRLGLVVPVALAAILLLLYLTLGSVRQAVLVFANVPLAMIGGVFALWAAGEYLSVPASVGFIALLGIAVLNGVVMITHFNQLVAEGLPIDRVVVEGAQRRLRPVLMTATITALGLIPLILASGPGSEVQRPLAVVVTGGLLSSTFLTLVLLPIMFRRFGVPSGPAIAGEAGPAVAADGQDRARDTARNGERDGRAR
jgi:cobalt-zinc-cadmium resistance protein CzcA